MNIFEDDVGAANVDHVQSAAHNKTPLREVIPVSLSESGLKSRILDDGYNLLQSITPLVPMQTIDYLLSAVILTEIIFYSSQIL